MNERGRYTPEQQQWESQAAATIRALTHQHDLYFRAHRLYQRQHRLPYEAVHLQPDPAKQGVSALRGMGDGLALRIMHSDTALHARLLPEAALEQLFFELLEQLRVESLAPTELPGIRQNLREHFENWLLQFYHAGLTDTGVGLLVFTLAQIVWTRLNNYPPLEETEDEMEGTRAGIVPHIGQHITALKQHRDNQQAYAVPALAIAQFMMQQAQAEELNAPKTSKRSRIRVTKRLLQLLNINEHQEEEGFAAVSSGNSRSFEEQGGHYQVFTKAYDQVSTAQQLVRPALLQELRQQLDQRIHQAGLNLPRLVRQLQMIFAIPRRDGWDFGLDEGFIDGHRLSQLITSPAEQRIFKQEARPPHCHASVSFLLDCSGSMKKHASTLTVLLDVFGRALERVGVGCEILGFSTRSWNGGRALKDWRRQGRPDNPGRLNENLQIVFRAADQRWSQARTGLAALLKTDFYREGVDGEAVQWAAKRLLSQDVERRLLVVISDGCPMDSATAHANDAFYLDNHLQQMIARYDQSGQIEVYGLGVGLDLSPYYRRHLAVDLGTGADNQLLRDIVGLWAR